MVSCSAKGDVAVRVRSKNWQWFVRALNLDRAFQWLPGETVSIKQLFLWRKLYHDGSSSAISAGEPAVSVSELAEAMKQICELQRLGKKTMGAEVLKEPVEIARPRK